MSQGTIGFCIGMFTLLLFTLFLSVQIHSLQSLIEASSQFSQKVKQLFKNLSETKGFPRVYTHDGKSRKIFLKPSYVMAFFFFIHLSLPQFKYTPTFKYCQTLKFLTGEYTIKFHSYKQFLDDLVVKKCAAQLIPFSL